MKNHNVLKESLKNTYIKCHNKKDWDKLLLILSLYLKEVFLYEWYISAIGTERMQYINIESDLSTGYGSTSSIEKYTKGKEEIPLDFFFKYY